jgi:hypothetical protein
MSRDTKYIGMDVHKEAIVIAVLDDSGKLVMESIVETQPAASCSSSTVCEASYRSRGKKAPGQPGCTICSSPTCTKSWSAIRGVTPY